MTIADGWRNVPFGEMARSVTDRVDDPSAAGVDRYVGLEHLDPESLRIARWGAPSDVEATKLRFAPGDVIFGRRRAYQRKVAVADFEGICSAHALVLRANMAIVAPGFLPVFMQSDLFLERSLAISVGSLSPTINWRQLSRQEFSLPPLELQRRMADLLWASWKQVEAAENLVQTLRHLRASYISDRIERSTAPRVRFAELWATSPESGHSPAPISNETGHWLLTLAALTKDGYRSGHTKPVQALPQVLAARLEAGDLLVSRSNTPELVGFAGIFSESRGDVSFPDTMMRLHIKPDVARRGYIQAALLSPLGRAHMRRVAAGTSGSMRKINRTSLGAFVLPLPPIESQDAMVAAADEISAAVEAVNRQASNCRDLHAALLRSLLSPQDVST